MFDKGIYLIVGANFPFSLRLNKLEQKPHAQYCSTPPNQRDQHRQDGNSRATTSRHYQK